MRIWFDILTPKQVMFFKYFVEDLEESGHEIFCTGRNYREAIELAKIKKLRIKIVGKHGGNDRYEKLVASSERIRKLADIVNSFEPDLTVSFSSPEASRVSFGLGIKHYIFNDSPHALAVAKLSVPICDRLFCPWIIPYKAWLYLGINREKITRYRAIDPVVWVKKEMEKIKECRGWTTTRSQKTKKNQFTILIRPEEAKASYIIDNKNRKNSLALIDSIVKNFSLYSQVLILGRYQDQIDFFKRRYEKNVQILENVVDGISLLRKIDLFIGAGGTMSAEAALIGKPVISIAPISFYVENFLIRCGFVKKIRNEKELTRYTHNIFSKIKNEKKDFKNNDKLKKYKVSGFQKRLCEKSLKFIDSMEDPIVQFKKFI